MVKKLLLPFFILLSLISCNRTEKEKDVTWIGGQILNPQEGFVILAQGRKILDTIKLDSNNFFLYRSERLKEGLYTIRHKETQVIYLEPGDSILFHVNTIEFDESIAFSGKGAGRNNLLIDLYLKNERENKMLPTLYTLSPDEFTRKIDSMKQEKKTELLKFLDQHPEETEGFKEVALASIQYNYYSKKELYAMANRNRADSIGADFYSYREGINLNNEKLRFYYPYYRFLNRYFNGLMIAKYPPGTDLSSFALSVDKMRAIDSLVSNDSIRNSLLRFTALHYLFYSKEANEKKQFYDTFASLNTNPNHLKQIRQLTDATVNLSVGKKIPSIQLLSTDNQVVDLHDIITKPTVMYFWSMDSKNRADMAHNRAAELKSKFPEYNFLGINTDQHFKRWRGSVNEMKLNPDFEFQLEDVSKAERILVLGNMSKAIIIDRDGVILEGNTNMFNDNFEELLLGYLNR